MLLTVTAHNRGPEAAELTLLPQLWFRNTWSFKQETARPTLKRIAADVIEIEHPTLGRYFAHVEARRRAAVHATTRRT